MKNIKPGDLFKFVKKHGIYTFPEFQEEIPSETFIQNMYNSWVRVKEGEYLLFIQNTTGQIYNMKKFSGGIFLTPNGKLIWISWSYLCRTYFKKIS